MWKCTGEGVIDWSRKGGEGEVSEERKEPREERECSWIWVVLWGQNWSTSKKKKDRSGDWKKSDNERRLLQRWKLGNGNTLV
jgi:hypothetical protein